MILGLVLSPSTVYGPYGPPPPPPVPLTGAVISSITGSGTATARVSWSGGTAPFTVTFLGTPYVVSAQFVDIVFTPTAGGANYTATVADGTTQLTTPAYYYTPPYITVGSASVSFNTSAKTATFYAGAYGSPAPNIVWYVNIDGTGWQYWSSASSWTSGVYAPSSTLAAYYVASNSAGSGQSNVVYQGYV